MTIAYTGAGGGTVLKRMLDNLTTFAAGVPTQRFNVESIAAYSGIQVGDAWTMGVTKASRIVHEFENLPVDYTITNVGIIVTSVKGVSASNPAVMRFYQDPEETSASIIEIGGVGQYTDVLNFDITQSVYSPRKLVIDL